MVNLHFWTNNLVYWTTQNYPFFTEKRVIDTENILRKFEQDQIMFIDGNVLKVLKYKEIRVRGANIFDECI